MGPHRKNESVPLHVSTLPVTVRSAESVTDTLPVPIETLPPDPADGVVTRRESQPPSDPREKSKIVAVSDVDDRVSPMKVLKHSPPRPDVVRLIPPSKNSETRSECPTPSCLLEVSHGIPVSVPVFTRAQMSSSPVPLPHDAPCATGSGLSAPFAPPTQR